MKESILKELEKAVQILKEMLKDKEEIIKYHSWVGINVIEAIEIILKELENSISKDKINQLIKELKIEGNYKSINNVNGRVHFLPEKVDYQIEILEKLLKSKC